MLDYETRMAIPSDIWIAAEVAIDRATNETGEHIAQSFTDYVAQAIFAERESCAKLVDCDCDRYCDRKEAAEKIRATRGPEKS